MQKVESKIIIGIGDLVKLIFTSAEITRYLPTSEMFRVELNFKEGREQFTNVLYMDKKSLKIPYKVNTKPTKVEFMGKDYERTYSPSSTMYEYYEEGFFIPEHRVLAWEHKECLKYENKMIDITPWYGIVTEIKTPTGYVFVKVLGFDGIEREFNYQYLKLL